MHEESIVRSLLEQVRMVAETHNAVGCVTEICVEVGEFSGVEPLLVQSAFERLVRGTDLAEAVLSLRQTPLRAECDQCQLVFRIRNFEFVCPECGAFSVRVVSGDQFRLTDVTVETD